MSLSVWHKFCVTETGIYCRYSMWKELIIINLVPQGTVLEQYHRKLSKKKNINCLEIMEESYFAAKTAKMQKWTVVAFTNYLKN